MKHNRSIERCLLLFRKFRENPHPTTTELARLTNLPRPTVMRFLLTLEGENYVARDHERWRLTAKVLEIGFAALESSNVTDLVQSTVGALADRFAGTANIGEKIDDRIIIIARSVASPEVRRFHVSNLRVGSTLSHDSAMSQAISAEYCSKVYEDVNQVSLAVPIRNTRGRFLCLGIATSLDILTDSLTENQAIEELKAEAKRIGRMIDIDSIS